MKLLLRFCVLCVLFLCLPAAWGQMVSRVAIEHIGPASVSDELVRANIRIKPGDEYKPSATEDDVHSLYATGLFYNIRVKQEPADDGGVVITYLVQPNPRLMDIKLEGNKKIDASKIKKKITSKVGEPLSELKLFTDSQAIETLYQKSGYPGTVVSNIVNIDENAGRGTATFEIHESPKVKIIRVEFIGAQAFSQNTLRKQIKTRKRWMFSWLTGSGIFKDDQLQEDLDKLAGFYRDKGYIDFQCDLKDVEQVKATPGTMVLRIHVYEGSQYKVGTVSFQGTTLFPTNEVDKTFKLKPGAVFAPSQLSKDAEKIEDFYGAKGHIDVTTATGDLMIKRIPNTETGTMDLQYQIDEGQQSYVEKIEIRGNTKTKDKVIRRELAISPGEVFDMVRVKVSQKRLEGLQFFAKVDARPEPTDAPNRKNLVIGVEEKSTGNLTFGAGFSSVDSVVGYAEVTQGNFDLFHPPTFTGGGQKFRLRVQLGTERKDYELSFVEPWFLGRKLSLGADFYYRDLNFQSVNSLYDEVRAGARLSLTRALGSDFLIGSISYTLEDVGILLNNKSTNSDGTAYQIPPSIQAEDGYSLLHRFGASLAYDTRNSTFLPDSGQRTEVDGEVVVGNKQFYKLELKSGWYFRGLFKGHVLEAVGRAGVTDGFHGGSNSVPFYERFYLGGLNSLRGFRYRDVGPKEPIGTGNTFEPVGGDTYWFGSVEYSIPIFQQERGVGLRFALFYDIGMVYPDAFSFSPQPPAVGQHSTGTYSDNWGIGLRLNLPIGPLRLDYGLPLHPNGSGRFQFGVGFTRPF